MQYPGQYGGGEQRAERNGDLLPRGLVARDRWCARVGSGGWGFGWTGGGRGVVCFVLGRQRILGAGGRGRWDERRERPPCSSCAVERDAGEILIAHRTDNLGTAGRLRTCRREPPLPRQDEEP